MPRKMMMKKLALPATALSMLAVASVPVLAQEGFEDGSQDALTEEDTAAAREAAEADGVFQCAFLSGDPSTDCLADEDGFYTTKSRIRFPVFGYDSEKNAASFIQYGGVPGSEPIGPG